MRSLALACAAVLVASSATAAVRLRADRSTSALVVLDTPPRTPEPTETPEPTAATTPSRTATPTPKPKPAPTATRTPEQTTPPPPLPRTPVTLPCPPAPPGPLVAPVEPGHWLVTACGVLADVRVTPAVPRAGEVATFTVRTSSTGAACCVVDLFYADGNSTPEQYCDGLAYPHTATSAVQTFRHAFRRGGTARAWVHVYERCGGPRRYLSFEPAVRVADGPVLPNGPWPPVASVRASDDEVPEDPADGQIFYGDVFDHDGAAWTFSWDFGDGTRTSARRAGSWCRWGRDDLGWPNSEGTSRVTHRYAQPGTYTITFTATTAGCDGKGQQTATATMRWVTSSSEPVT